MGIEEKKVTLEEVNDQIAAEFYFTAADGAYSAALLSGLPYDENSPLLEGMKRFTFCTLVLKNGFIVHGVNSCVSADVWKADIAKQMAKENALEQVWLILGYQLKDQLHTRAV